MGRFPLTPVAVKKIGFAAGKILQTKSKNGSKTIIIAKDTRASCDWIEQSLSQGLSKSGCQILSCGVLPTSAVAMILQEDGFLAGSVISASHNPAEFNGIKFFTSDGKKIPDDWEKKIETELARQTRLNHLRTACSPEIFAEAESLYLGFLKKAVDVSFNLEGMRWVLDCANGAASKIAPALFESLGAEVIAIHNAPDGKNINSNCGAVHPASLQKKVVQVKADGGCAFDGDADRVQFVDEEGRLMDGDILIALAAEALKKSGHLKNNTVVTTVMANLGFFQQMKKQEIEVITTSVGDRAVSEAMESSGAMLGGEQSGHIIFREILSTGDGILTALKILEIVRKSGKKFSHFIDTFQKRPQLLLNLKVKERIPIESLPVLSEAIRAAEKNLADRGRILVRYSGTEPLLRIMVQGNSSTEIERAAHDLAEVAREVLG